MTSDSTQRQKSLDITTSFIVQAPAGSGKTELLTQRYLKLLSLSIHPESVVALTFTNKAVAELKTRVLHSLELANKTNKEPSQAHKKITFTLAQQVLKQDKKYSWDLLKNPHRFNISTIDSLATKIVSSYPNASNFATKNTTDDFTAQALYLKASEQTLRQIDAEPSVFNLLTHLEGSSAKFVNLVREMLIIRDKWLPQVTEYTKINTRSMQTCVENIHTNYLQNLQHLATTELSDSFFNMCTRNTKLTNLTSIPSTIEEWSVFKELIFTKKGEVRKTIGTFSDAEDKQKFSALIHNFSADFCQMVVAVDTLPHTILNEELIGDIIKVLLIANFHLQELFNSSNQSDFTQIMLDANDNLDVDSGVSNISLILDYSIEHILMDEFQDTSYTQLSLIEKIVQHWTIDSGRTLFLVGDPMQSIYLFRGAQVGVFLQAKNAGIAGITLENLTLEQNFRSTQDVVATNNAIFQNVFPKFDDIDNGCISFAKSVSNNTNTDVQSLHIYPFTQHQEDREARAVLDIIAKNPHQEIAILCINRNHLQTITIELRKQNIVFEAIKQHTLIDDKYTTDLLNIVQILLNPTHKLAWFTVLNSPRCGLLLDDILTLSAGDILQNLQHPQGLSDDGEWRVRNIWQVFEHALENIGSFSIVDIFNNLINNLRITSNNSVLEKYINQQFSEILHHCETRNTVDIETITEYLQNMYAPTTPSNIKIMTVHESKGLEFDIVIFPALGKAKRAESAKLMYLNEFTNKEMLLAAAHPSDMQNYNYLREIEKKRAHYENMRLLYVALTRAKSQLHLLGAVGKSLKPVKNSLLYLLWNTCGHYWNDIDAENENQPTVEQAVEVWQRYDFAIHGDKAENIVRFEQENNINYKQQHAKIIGTVVHKFLQLEQCTPSDESINNQLFNYGIANNTESVAAVATMLQNTRCSTDFDFIFKRRESTQVEAEFAHKGQTIIIDRLFIEDDTLWIIDYKTNTYNEEVGIETFIELQKTQHNKQLTNYKNILTNIYTQPIKTAIFLTSIGRMVILD